MELLAKIEKVVYEAGKIVLSAKDIESVTNTKTSAADLVTAYDVKVENFLKENLTALVPEAMFFGEEEKENKDPGDSWVFIVDPIDGTANFVHDMAHSAVSVALAKGCEVRYAFCYHPYRDEMFTAKRGEGAFCNGSPIHVSETPIEEGIFAFGTSPYNKSLHPSTLKLLSQLYERSCDMRRMGSAVLDLCYLAIGRVDLFFEYELSPWDYAAASLIVEEAGGKITTMEGKKLPVIKKCSVFASNSANTKLLSKLDV